MVFGIWGRIFRNHIHFIVKPITSKRGTWTFHETYWSSLVVDFSTSQMRIIAFQSTMWCSKIIYKSECLIYLQCRILVAYMQTCYQEMPVFRPALFWHFVRRFQGNLRPSSTATTHHSFRGSFSAGSTPIFASKYAFCSIFQDLQENHFHAAPNFKHSQNSSNFFVVLFDFMEKSQVFDNVHRIYYRS